MFKTSRPRRLKTDPPVFAGVTLLSARDDGVARGSGKCDFTGVFRLSGAFTRGSLRAFSNSKAITSSVITFAHAVDIFHGFDVSSIYYGFTFVRRN